MDASRAVVVVVVVMVVMLLPPWCTCRRCARALPFIGDCSFGFHAAVMSLVWFVVIPASVFAVHLFPHIEGFNVAHRVSTRAVCGSLSSAVCLVAQIDTLPLHFLVLLADCRLHPRAHSASHCRPLGRPCLLHATTMMAPCQCKTQSTATAASRLLR